MSAVSKAAAKSEAVTLDPELLQSVKAEARRARIRPETFIVRAIRSQLEHAEDVRAVEKARKRSGKSIPWAQVKKNLGLDR